MNRISAISILAVASLATCAAANGQQKSLIANIPFDFAVGNAWMPAGEYAITSPSQGVLELKSSSHAAVVVSIQSHDESNSGSELVFDRYGNQYFLHEVLCPSLASLNLRIAPNKEEKRARMSAIEAKVHGSGEQTMVAAR